MRRTILLRAIVLTSTLAVLLGAATVAGALRGFDGRVNGTGSSDGTKGAVRCEVQDPTGEQVTVVSASELGDASYWLFYGSGGNFARRVMFRVRPLFPESPLDGQGQVFTETEFDNIQTPFGIPFWGLDLTSGPWQLRVSNDNGQSATCNFEVVP